MSILLACSAAMAVAQVTSTGTSSTPKFLGHGLADGDDQAAFPLAVRRVLGEPGRRLGDAHAQLAAGLDLVPGRLGLSGRREQRDGGEEGDDGAGQVLHWFPHVPFLSVDGCPVC